MALKSPLKLGLRSFVLLLKLCFTLSQYDYSLIFHKSPTSIVLILFYVDYLIITSTDHGLITKLQVELHVTFHIERSCSTRILFRIGGTSSIQ